MPRVAKKVDPATTETWRKNVVEAVADLVKDVEAPAEVEAVSPAAPAVEKKVRLVKKKKPVDAAPAAAAAPVVPVEAPATAPDTRKTGLYPRCEKKTLTKKVSANAPLTEPAPAPGAKREKHPNAKQFVKISDDVRGKLAEHAHKDDRTYMRRLRTHLMLGKSYEEATKLTDAKKSASA
jgi:hypothetical protein